MRAGVAAQIDATWTDPAKAKAEDPDFSIQGEYGRGLTGQALGAQVVALGDDFCGTLFRCFVDLFHTWI